MKKIYLVYTQECDKNGFIKENGKKFINQVFTNEKKAHAYVNFFNKKREMHLEKDDDFEKYQVLWYYVECMMICNVDYSKIPY